MNLKALVKFNSMNGLSANEQALRQKHAARVAQAQQRSAIRGAATLEADNNRPLIRKAEAQARLQSRMRTRTFLTTGKRIRRSTVATVKPRPVRNVGIKKSKPIFRGLRRTGLIGAGVVGALGAGIYASRRLNKQNKQVNYNNDNLLTLFYNQSPNRIRKPRKPRRLGLKTASNMGSSALAGAGTGSLAALIIKPESGKAQRTGAFIGGGIGAVNSLRNSLRSNKPKRSY